MSVALKIKVSSVGDHVDLADGYFTPHSIFKNAVNVYFNSSSIFSIVTKSVGSGPNNVVLDVEDVSFIKKIYFDGVNIILNDDFVCNVSSAPIYKSELIVSQKNTNYLPSGLSVFERIIKRESAPLSTAFLLDKRRKNFFITPFEKSLANMIDNSMEEIFKGNLQSISKLKGLGFGLTPQGDDVINGFIIALLLYEKLTGVSTEKLRKTIFDFAEGTNIISRTFLWYSTNGYLYERMKRLIFSLFSNDSIKIEKATKGLLSIGETSGADLSTGFLLMIRKLLQNYYKEVLNGCKRYYKKR